MLCRPVQFEVPRVAVFTLSRISPGALVTHRWAERLLLVPIGALLVVGARALERSEVGAPPDLWRSVAIMCAVFLLAHIAVTLLTPNADQVVNWSDIPQFPRSIMIKGLKVLLWGQKGFDTTQLVDDYNKELAAYMAQMQGAPVINLSSTSDLFLLDARRNTPDGSW